MGLYIGGLYRYDGREFKYFKESDGVPAEEFFRCSPKKAGYGSDRMAGWAGS